MKYYSLKNILKMNAQYNIIIGDAKTGKTFAVLDYIIKDYLKNGNKAIIIRRKSAEWLLGRPDIIFYPLERFISKYTNGVYNTIYYKDLKWYLAYYNKNTTRIKLSDTPFCYAEVLNRKQSNRKLLNVYDDVVNILFDDFILFDEKYYLKQEPFLFLNLLSSIFRIRDNGKVFMLGNYKSENSPYFEVMGLPKINEMIIGTIKVYYYDNNKLKVAVECI
mgnify:CR=1 FL=1